MAGHMQVQSGSWPSLRETSPSNSTLKVGQGLAAFRRSPQQSGPVAASPPEVAAWQSPAAAPRNPEQHAN